MVDQQTHRRLVERVLANGRCRSQAARLRLQGPLAAAPAGLGLALQRLCELTYSAGDAETAVARRLLCLQGGDGLFGAGPEPHLGATAVAVGALLAYRRLAGGPGAAVDAAIDQALEAVADVVATGAVDRVDLELVVWQLGREPRFRSIETLRRLSAGLRTSRRGRDELPAFAAAAAA
jgi:hypothetical protein